MMDYEHPQQKLFYNCKVQMFDRENKLLGTSYFNVYKPDPRYIEDFVVKEDNEHERTTETRKNNFCSGIRYVIVEDKKKVRL